MDTVTVLNYATLEDADTWRAITWLYNPADWRRITLTITVNENDNIKLWTDWCDDVIELPVPGTSIKQRIIYNDQEYLECFPVRYQVGLNDVTITISADYCLLPGARSGKQCIEI